MRLTLRTLLAYLDGVLEPADHDDLHRQIEASDYARDLIHRTRDVSRRLRLGTPEPLGEGPIDDPNTMAEYLDNTLPVENVPEFERHCLESDAMLAEAASSHHVLAMVLGRPAEVDPETRDRLHTLPSSLRDRSRNRVDAPHAAAADASPPPLPSSGGRLPDYLREKEGNALLRWLPAVAAAVLLAVTAYLTLAPGGEDDTRSVAEAAVDASDAARVAAVPAETDGATPGEDAEEGGDAEAPAEVSAVVSGETTPGDEAASTGAPESGGEAAEPGAAAVEAAPPAGGSAPEEELGGALAEGDTSPNDATPQPEENAATGVVASDDASSADAAPDAATPAETDDTAEEAEPVIAGRFIGPAGCVLVEEIEPDVWRRVRIDAEAAFDRRLLTLPTYRGEIELPNGLSLRLVGLSEIVFPSPTRGERTPRLDLRYGRVVIANPGAETASVRLRIAGASSEVEIEPAGSLAIDSDRPFDPGFDVLNASPPPVTRLYAPDSLVTWIADGVRLHPETAKQWELPAAGGIASLVDYAGDPGWIETIRLNSWDEQASPRLASVVDTSGEVWPQLQAVIDNSAFKEVRALAARSSGAVSHPEPLVASFDDVEQKSRWAENLAVLRRLVSRSTIEAERVRRAFAEKYGDRSERFFPLVTGSGAGEPTRESLDALLDLLESDTLAPRVLASLNLAEVTGRRDFFGPADVLKDRRRALRRLRNLLQDGELVSAAAGG